MKNICIKYNYQIKNKAHNSVTLRNICDYSVTNKSMGLELMWHFDIQLAKNTHLSLSGLNVKVHEVRTDKYLVCISYYAKEICVPNMKFQNLILWPGEVYTRHQRCRQCTTGKA